jgi:hypothetical protein
MAVADAGRAKTRLRRAYVAAALWAVQVLKPPGRAETCVGGLGATTRHVLARGRT